MSLQAIFDPVVRAYFKKLYGGSDSGSIMDDGCNIVWTGTTAGKESISVHGSPTFYKVSSNIYNAEQFLGSKVGIVLPGYSEPLPTTVAESMIISTDSFAIVAASSDRIFIVSGKAGSYNYEGVDVTIPSDGTYFLYATVDTADGLSPMYTAFMSKNVYA